MFKRFWTIFSMGAPVILRRSRWIFEIFCCQVRRLSCLNWSISCFSFFLIVQLWIRPFAVTGTSDIRGNCGTAPVSVSVFTPPLLVPVLWGGRFGTLTRVSHTWSTHFLREEVWKTVLKSLDISWKICFGKQIQLNVHYFNEDCQSRVSSLSLVLNYSVSL